MKYEISEFVLFFNWILTMIGVLISLYKEMYMIGLIILGIIISYILIMIYLDQIKIIYSVSK